MLKTEKLNGLWLVLYLFQRTLISLRERCCETVVCVWGLT